MVDTHIVYASQIQQIIYLQIDNAKPMKNGREKKNNTQLDYEPQYRCSTIELNIFNP